MNTTGQGAAPPYRAGRPAPPVVDGGDYPDVDVTATTPMNTGGVRARYLGPPESRRW
jgi:hypothetical protein